jgi:hypothetical protein
VLGTLAVDRASPPFGAPVVRGFGWPPQLHEQLFWAAAARRASALVIRPRRCWCQRELALAGHISGEAFFAVICVDNVDAASAGLGDLVVSG